MTTVQQHVQRQFDRMVDDIRQAGFEVEVSNAYDGVEGYRMLDIQATGTIDAFPLDQSLRIIHYYSALFAIVRVGYGMLTTEWTVTVATRGTVPGTSPSGHIDAGYSRPGGTQMSDTKGSTFSSRGTWFVNLPEDDVPPILRVLAEELRIAHFKSNLSWDVKRKTGHIVVETPLRRVGTAVKLVEGIPGLTVYRKLVPTASGYTHFFVDFE